MVIGMKSFLIIQVTVCCTLFFVLIGCGKPQPDQSKGEDRDTDSGHGGRPLTTKVERERAGKLPSQIDVFQDSLEKAKVIEDLETREAAITKLAWGVLDTDQDLFQRALDALPTNSVGRSSLIQAQVAQLAREDPDAALRWMERFDSREEKDMARNEIVQFFADSDPDRAAQFIGRPKSGADELDTTRLYVIHRLAAEKPAAAASWVASFPEGEARESAMRTVASDWVQSAPEAAFSWIQSLHDPSLQKEATKGVLDALAEQPEDLRAEALKLANPPIRAEIENQLDALKLEIIESSHEDY